MDTVECRLQYVGSVDSMGHEEIARVSRLSGLSRLTSRLKWWPPSLKYTVRQSINVAFSVRLLGKKAVDLSNFLNSYMRIFVIFSTHYYTTVNSR